MGATVSVRPGELYPYRRRLHVRTGDGSPRTAARVPIRTAARVPIRTAGQPRA
ncbi:hypothetical protein [Streptomyces sp. NPDC088261]|uniref:hypothetical protein n=1 Tax=Streptomyces sp. NPDC088261 TaxID=3365851 RepID=UPI00382C6AA8